MLRLDSEERHDGLRMTWLGSVSSPLKKAFLRLRWPLLGLLACSFVMMLVEIAISDFDPEPEGPVEYLGLLLGGTLWIFTGILFFLVLPLLLIIGIPWLLIARARGRAKGREPAE